MARLENILLFAFAGLMLMAPVHLVKGSLDKVGPAPPSYNWDSVIAESEDQWLTAVFKVLKTYNLPSAVIGYRLNPNSTYVSYTPPSAWSNPESWWMAGYGYNYRTPMRVASVSKPLAYSVYANNALLKLKWNNKFYNAWETYVGPLPTPKDPRVLQITIKHLLDHKSGFSNSLIGFDPAFAGKSVEDQIGPILEDTLLWANPGGANSYNYSNFGYMVLARLAEGITQRSWLVLNRKLFPGRRVPVFAASDTVPVSATIAGAAEPSTYYVQSPDGEFDVSVMAGNGNIVSNVATLTWYATQYWMGGTKQGKKFSVTGVQPGYTWVMTGSMPGTMAMLVQYTTPKRRVSSICIITNTRVPNSSAFFTDLQSAAIQFLQKTFAGF